MADMRGESRVKGNELKIASARIVVGLGEVLWDFLPSGRQLGGAPANFAYISTILGNCGVVASRIGDDALGEEAIAQLRERTLQCDYLQRDPKHPTGTVKVSLDSQRQPGFVISEAAAWDSLEWTPEWKALAQGADAVCFGSLAQRSAESRETIQSFLEHTAPDTLRVFDVNLRQSYYSAKILAASCKLADLVKMNEDEFPTVLESLRLSQESMELSARQMIETFDLKLVCITRGAGGSLLVAKNFTHSHPGIPCKVADSVGAGDAFTAGLVHEYLHKKNSHEAELDEQSLALMNERGNRMGAWVASQAGAMPSKRGQF
ncbi:MAG TPA: carbohydrate kinase [Terriglobales bacterium]|jgi:fructokinase